MLTACLARKSRSRVRKKEFAARKLFRFSNFPILDFFQSRNFVIFGNVRARRAADAAG
jgi:hypothetical protein